MTDDLVWRERKDWPRLHETRGPFATPGKVAIRLNGGETVLGASVFECGGEKWDDPNGIAAAAVLPGSSAKWADDVTVAEPVPDPREIVAQAEAYARANLSQCAAELAAWRNTGLLPGDHIRTIADLLKPCYEPHHIGQAEKMVVDAAIDAAAAQSWRALADVQPEPGECVAVGWYLRGSGKWCTGTYIAPIGKPYTHWLPLPPPPVKP